MSGHLLRVLAYFAPWLAYRLTRRRQPPQAITRRHITDHSTRAGTLEPRRRRWP